MDHTRVWPQWNNQIRGWSPALTMFSPLSEDPSGRCYSYKTASLYQYCISVVPDLVCGHQHCRRPITLLRPHGPCPWHSARVSSYTVGRHIVAFHDIAYQSPVLELVLKTLALKLRNSSNYSYIPHSAKLTNCNIEILGMLQGCEVHNVPRHGGDQVWVISMHKEMTLDSRVEDRLPGQWASEPYSIVNM